MPITSEFLERLKQRIERIDQKGLQAYVLDLVKEREFLMTLLDEIQQGVMVLSLSGDVILLNRRMAQILNVPSNVNVKYKLSDIIQDFDLLKMVSRGIKNQEEIFNRELEVLLPRPMMLEISLLLTEYNKIQIAVFLAKNLSQSEVGIREKFRLENIKTLTGLAAGIAHEIGNPLNSLNIQLKLLSKAVKGSNVKEKKKIEESLHAIEEETRRLDQIVRNFLKAVRQKPLHFELVQLNDLLQKTVSFLKPELKENKVEAVLDLEQSMPEFLFDPDRMRQVFINLIKNAMHAMPKGGTLKIWTERRDKVCSINFQDTGVGIPEEKISKIFDAYYTTKEEGSGLGLMIVQQIIAEHGGRIEVASQIKEGTTFSVILPIRKEKLRLPQPPKGEAAT